MKKLFATVLVIFSSNLAIALPIGNPAEVNFLCTGLWDRNCDYNCSWCHDMNFRLGFYGDYVFNRHLTSGNRGNPDDIEHTRIYTNAGYLAAVWNWLEVFSTLGVTNLFLQTNLSAFNPGDQEPRAEIESASAFSWSLGARAAIWQCRAASLSLEGQYFSTDPNVKRLAIQSGAAKYLDEQVFTRYSEWQVGLALSYRINILTPYVGVKWSKAHWDFNNATSVLEQTPVAFPDLKADKHFGYAVGVSILSCNLAAVTIEGRFADEKALYINGQIRF